MGKNKILLIEDEPDQIEMIRMRLEANGFSVISAQDGAQGLRKASEEKPDLIILDVVMPHMDGFQVCNSLQQGEATKSIPILILTASGRKDVEDKCLDCGAKCVLKKPYDSKELMSKINSLL